MRGAECAAVVVFRVDYGRGMLRADVAMARLVPAWPEYHSRSDQLLNFTGHGSLAERGP